MRKLIYHIATSIDGFIAAHDGSWDFFPQAGDHIADYLESWKSYDAVLMGRKTYEIGLKLGVTNPYPSMRSYVFSRSMTASPDQQVQLVSSDVLGFVADLKQQPGKDIYLCGGGELATQLLEADLVDQIKLKLNPLVIGAGIGMLGALARPLNLQLLDSKVYSSDVILLTYGVQHAASAAS